jgi:hypothetical protein
MGKKGSETLQKPIRFPMWMYKKLEELAEINGQNFSDCVIYYLQNKLYAMGQAIETEQEEIARSVFKKKDIESIMNSGAEPLNMDTEAASL